MKIRFLYTLIALLIILSACNSTKNMDTKDSSISNTATNNAFDKQGHRGCRGLMPENTIAAMLHALDLGVTTLELDVVITKDNQVILSHEPFFNHEITTKPDGTYVTEAEEHKLNIFQMNYDEVKTFDIGLKPHPRFPKQQKLNAIKPLLSNLFDSVNLYMKKAKRPFPFFNIETKTKPASDNINHPAPGVFVQLLMKVISEKQMEKQVTVQSFDFRTLQYLHHNFPAIKTSMLIEEGDTNSLEDQLQKNGFNPNVYSPHFLLVNETLIKKCHDKKILVIPWTVNDKATIESLRKSGVDGVITDYPDLFN